MTHSIRRLIDPASMIFFTILFCSTITFAADGAEVHGTITDSLGAVVPNAKVQIVRDQEILASGQTDSVGAYSLKVSAAGQYIVRTSAQSFQDTESAPIFISASAISTSAQRRVDLTLFPGKLDQAISVTATGTPVPLAQVGSAVTILESDQFPFTREVQQPLRSVPGVQLTQVGDAGSETTLFIRGGNSDANKVLLDGVPVNFAGSFPDFAWFKSAGVQQIEVLRGPNSALYGSDALSGVVSITTAQGATPLPRFSYSAEGGNFGTYRQDGSIGGLFRQFDYFSEYDASKTSGDLPNNDYRYGNYGGNFGWTPNAATSLRVILHSFGSHAGEPGAVAMFGIADNSVQNNDNTFMAATFENQTTEHWHNLTRYGRERLRQLFTDPSPTGTPYDPFNTGFPVYLGNPVTLHGANGYTVGLGTSGCASNPTCGQAILNYSGIYPSQTEETTNRDFIYAQSQYVSNAHLSILGAFKYESERGISFFSGSSPTQIERGNYSYTMQLAGDFWNRLYYTVGSGIENNAVFGVEGTPRASLAYYLLRPSPGIFSGTKLRASFGKGIKEPSIDEQGSSLYDALLTTPGGPAFIAVHGIGQVGAEQSRNYDGGIDQIFANGRVRASITYFHNQFSHGIEFVPTAGLIELGIPVGSFRTLFGAYVNSLAFRAQGVENEIEYRISKNLFARGGYTYLDATVQRSFSSDALSPSINPLFPTIPIGAYSPLVGQRPYRRAPHSGYFAISYQQPRWTASLSGTLVGRRDDSTFLSDANFGTTMLLPNRNLDPAYQRLDMDVSFRVKRHMSVYGLAQNLLCEHYYEAFGYEALPLTFRGGVRWTFGGESWSTK